MKHKIVLCILALKYVTSKEFLENNVKLTTQKTNDYEITNSSTKYGTLALQNSSEDYLYNRRKYSSKRKFFEDVSIWDYWCKLQPKGKIKDLRQNDKVSYYYDIKLDSCKPFYADANNDGNKNHFDSEIECHIICKGSHMMPVPELKSLPNDSFCSLQPDSGRCFALMYMFYYDINDNRCYKFYYGGCGGNQNRFTSIKKCLKSCRNYNYR